MSNKQELEPYTGLVYRGINSTELSIYVEQMCQTFLNSNLKIARIKNTKGYDSRKLDQAFRNKARSKFYRQRLSYHFQQGEMLLIRKDIADNCFL